MLEGEQLTINKVEFTGDTGSNGCIKKNLSTGRDELQIYAGGDAYEADSKGAGIHLYGNSDSQHAGNFAVLTGPNDNGDARIIASGREDKTHVTIGNATWDYVDNGEDPALLNLKGPSGQPALLIEGASDTEGDIVTPDGEAMQIGHWNKAESDPALAFTERMRMNSYGDLGIGTTSPTHALHVAKSHPNDFVAKLDNTSSSGPYVLQLTTSGAAPDDGIRYFIYANDSAALRFAVNNQGDVQNHDNSYGSLSDQRVKEDISDAASQWEDIKGLKVRKFKLKDDVRAQGDDAEFRLGLISQEAEAVSPNLITENEASINNILSSSEFGTLYEDGDDIPDGKKVGDVKERTATVKGIKYSILYMKAVKALQEAMARIETLETKVEALENA